ncbi:MULTISPECIES: hypothetical protein [unclassified Sphingobacterium]|uniref:hypothetical protein n=1 Tax=unclassified Sphingobacterium TaxID=2609468 RepID=UPI0010E72583|nr:MULTISPECIES: hypothetical protein [unclassified Sphingobacterium]MCS3552735.1 hypothetical protein [Sphingobacterium sp. JUb21]TCR10507.1 hypothetical protein EDF66_101321 [Sphingobacterium sp. JUb20]
MDEDEKVQQLLNYVNHIADLLEIDDDKVLYALSNGIDDSRLDYIFEEALQKV